MKRLLSFDGDFLAVTGGVTFWAYLNLPFSQIPSSTLPLARVVVPCPCLLPFLNSPTCDKACTTWECGHACWGKRRKKSTRNIAKNIDMIFRNFVHELLFNDLIVGFELGNQRKFILIAELIWIDIDIVLLLNLWKWFYLNIPKTSDRLGSLFNILGDRDG